MRRLFLILLLCSSAFAATPITVSGTLQVGSSSGLRGNAFVRFRLRNFSGFVPRITGTAIIVQTQFDVRPSDSLGNFSTSLYSNDDITPNTCDPGGATACTWWTVEYWNDGKVSSSGNYCIPNSSPTYNINGATPCQTPPLPPSPSAGGTGTVTFVGMTGDNVIFNTTVAGSPITASGTLVPTLKTQTANTVFAGPTSGGAATPAFRALVPADLSITPGLVLTSTGLTPAPSPAVTNCPTGEAVFAYGLDSGGNYQQLASWNSAAGASTKLGRWDFCHPFAYNDTGTAITEIKEAFRITHLAGQGTTPSTVRDERSVDINFVNTGTDSFHQAIGGVYADWTVIGNPTFGGHPGGEASIQIFRGNTTDARTNGASLSSDGAYVYTGQFEKQTTSVEPSGKSGVYWGEYTNEAAGNQSGVNPAVYGGICDDINGTDTNHACSVFVASLPSNRFPTNYGFFSANFGTNAADWDMFLGGVNTAGTAAGYWGGTGPLSVGTAAHAASTYQFDLLGAAKFKAGAGVRQIDLFGSTSGSCGLSTDATSTTLTNTCAFAGTTLSLTGLLTSYNGITTAGLSFPVQVGSSTLSGQTTSLGPTTLFTVGGATTSYLVSARVYCDTAVATATVTLSIGYTDSSNTAQTVTPSAAACTTLGAASFALIQTPIRAKNATTITYTTTAANSPNYDVSVQVYQQSTN